tara:strand:+ start:366 stop:599 length:234 start_codon:yes stop_codon:yes gene_type:complete
MDNKTDEIVLRLPEKSINKIKERMVGTDFNTVADYIGYIIEQVLASVEETQPTQSFEDDPEKINERMKRLESLGYLD